MHEQTIQKITVACFAGMISILSLWNLTAEKPDVSYNENRTLQKMPNTSLEHILSGKFDDEFEKWFSDHFVVRDNWITTKAAVKKAGLCIENNDVYFAEKGQLIGAFRSYREDTLQANLELIEEFAENNQIIPNVLLIPTAAWSGRSALPKGSWDLDQDQLLSSIDQRLNNVNFVPVEGLSAEDYFKTDHHWNHNGAQKGYEAIAGKILNKEPNTFTFEEVSSSFHGTMYSRSGAFWTDPDPIYAIHPDKEVHVEVTYDSTEETQNSIFSPKRLDEKDQYMYYVDGNHAEVHIRTDVPGSKKAVLVKDSYAHILIPYLITEYSEIEMIDLRYYHSPVSELLGEDTDLYVLYSLDNFCEDPNLAFLR